MAEQPMPTKGTMTVRTDAFRTFCDVLDAQCRKGQEKYGTALETFNGRDALADALAELVDAFQYVMQAKMERDASMQFSPRLRAVLRAAWEVSEAHYADHGFPDAPTRESACDTLRAAFLALTPEERAWCEGE